MVKKLINKILFYSIAGLCFFFFFFNIFLGNSNLRSSDTIEYISTSFDSKGITLIEYLSNEEEIFIASGDSFYRKIDENGTSFEKIIKISENEYAVLAKKGIQYYVYIFSQDGYIKNEIFIESGQLNLNDFVYVNNTYTFVGQKNGKPYILNTSRNGDMRWSNIINEQGSLNSIKNTVNGWIIGGYIITNNQKDAYLLEIGSTGNKIWENTYGREKDEEIIDMIVSNNNIIAIGTSNSNPERQKDLLILKYSREGILIFQDEYGYTSFNENPTTIARDSEGNIYISGYTTTLNEREWKGFILKINKQIENLNSLEVEFFEILSIGALSRVEDIYVDNNKIYLIGYSVESWPDYDIFLRVINSNNILIDQRIYKGKDREIIKSFEILSNGGFIGVGEIIVENEGSYPLIMKTDKDYKIRK